MGRGGLPDDIILLDEPGGARRSVRRSPRDVTVGDGVPGLGCRNEFRTEESAEFSEVELILNSQQVLRFELIAEA